MRARQVVQKALCVALAAALVVAPIAARAQAVATSFQNIPVTGQTPDGLYTFAGTFTVNHFQAVGDQLLAVGQITGTYTPTSSNPTGQPISGTQSIAWPVQSIDGKTLGSNPPRGPTGGFGGTESGSLLRSPNVKPAVFRSAEFASDSGARPLIIQAQAGGSCQILDLVLGPLHLDLLGLVVDLNQVHLQITAQQGSGNLLGNLLCAVANLLNGTGGGGGGGLSGLLHGIASLLNQILGVLNGL